MLKFLNSFLILINLKLIKCTFIITSWLPDFEPIKTVSHNLDTIPFGSPLQSVSSGHESPAAAVWPCYLTLWPRPLLYSATNQIKINSNSQLPSILYSIRLWRFQVFWVITSSTHPVYFSWVVSRSVWSFNITWSLLATC